MFKTALWLAVAVVLSRIAPGGEAAEFDRTYKLVFKGTLSTKANATAGEKAQETVMKMGKVVEYRHVLKERELSVYFLSEYSRAQINGNNLQESFISKEKMTATSPNGEKEEQRTADIPDEALKKALLEAFEKPRCVATLDVHGAIIKRAEPQTVAAKTALEDGSADNLLLFHGAFHADKNEWEESKRFSGGDKPVTFTLKYEKQPPAADTPHLTPVKFSGTFTMAFDAEKAGISSAPQNISGVKQYDTKLKSFVWGTMEIRGKHSLAAKTGETGESTIQMNVTMTDTTKPKK